MRRWSGLPELLGWLRPLLCLPQALPPVFLPPAGKVKSSWDSSGGFITFK